VRQVSILESSNSDDKTLQENNIKLALGKTVMKFIGLKLPRGSMQALVRSFGPLGFQQLKVCQLTSVPLLTGANVIGNGTSWPSFFTSQTAASS
jgi:hypothetical protein